METRWHRFRHIPLTALFSLGIITLIAACYIGAIWLATPLDPMSTALVYVTSGLSVCVAGGFLVSIVMLVYLGVREYGAGLIRTPFYRPQILKHAFLLAVTGPGGVRGIDRILHHGQVNWMWLLDPEVIVAALLCYFGVLVCSLWFNASWVITSYEDHRKARRRVTVACVGFEVFLVALLFALYWWGSR